MNLRKPEFTHFVSIPVNEAGQLTELCLQFKRSFEWEASLEKAFVAPTKLHITLAMLNLSNPESKQEQLEKICEILQNITRCIPPLSVSLNCLGLMRGSPQKAQVVHINIDKSDTDFVMLAYLVETLKLELTKAEILTDDSLFNPHVTLINTKYINRKKRITFDATACLESNTNLDWGRYPIHSIHLSKVQSVEPETGYYQHEYVFKLK